MKNDDPTLPMTESRPYSDAAKRALAEAKARRERAKPTSLPAEIGGAGGLEPTRYGDWEKKGLTSDF